MEGQKVPNSMPAVEASSLLNQNSSPIRRDLISILRVRENNFKFEFRILFSPETYGTNRKDTDNHWHNTGNCRINNLFCRQQTDMAWSFAWRYKYCQGKCKNIHSGDNNDIVKCSPFTDNVPDKEILLISLSFY